jgi:hypothetical protein
MSRKTRLLVEGRTDKRLFRFLLSEAYARAGEESARAVIDIDTAEQLISFEHPMGNREKVEEICASVKRQPYSNRLVGFVDREYREFETESTLEDRLPAHRVLGRLVWSRGHSAESYFFEFDTLREPLRAFAVTDYFDPALDRFESVFEATIRLALAASLAARECGMLPLAAKVDSAMVEVHPPDVCFMAQPWRQALCSRQGVTPEQADQLVEKLGTWRAVTNAAAYPVVRWMCHGHAGLAFIWAVYSRCVYDVCEDPDPTVRESEARRALGGGDSVRFNLCAASWAARALGGHCEYPGEVLSLLGIPEAQAPVGEAVTVMHASATNKCLDWLRRWWSKHRH